MKKMAWIIGAWWPFGVPAAPSGCEEDNVDLQHAWSISARLAALSSVSMAAAPPDVAELILEAQSLHPVMAEQQLLREHESLHKQSNRLK